MKVRILITFFIFGIFFSLVIGKAFYVQVVNADKLISYANSQFIREVEIFPKRGAIYDRNGEPLAINIQTYNIFTIPKDLKLAKKELKKLHKRVPRFNFNKVWSSIKKRKKYTWILRKEKIAKEDVAEIQKLKNIYIEPENSRFYPNHETMSQVLGFVGLDNQGLSGIEFEFNKQLKGKSKILKYYKDARGRPVKYQADHYNVDAKDINLSLDKDIQAALELYLSEAVNKHEALKGGAAVMDVETGEIWAMANYPSFDPNNHSSYPAIQKKASFVTDPFEPGSVFKLLTVASALENKIVAPDTSYYCDHGRLKIGSHIVSDSDTDKKHEWLSVKDIIKYSSNVGTTKIAFDLTFPRLKETVERFGIGERTGIEIPGESRGIFTKSENVTPLSLSNISFGQGVATTGIQMLSAFATIANKGEYVKPTVIKRENSNKIETKRIISVDTSNKLEQMLIEAVEDGTGSKAIIDHFQIAGKTSTAQKIEDGKYSGYISGFIGYPVNVAKKFVVSVYIDGPKKNGYYGNLVAGPVFNKITRFILLRNKEYSNLAKNTDEKKDFNKIDFVKTSHSSSMKLVHGVVPSFKGLDKKSSEEVAQRLNINVSHKGFGIVNSQSVQAGQKIEKGSVIQLNYSPPKYE